PTGQRSVSRGNGFGVPAGVAVYGQRVGLDEPYSGLEPGHRRLCGHRGALMNRRLVAIAAAMCAVLAPAGSALGAGVTLTVGHLTTDSHTFGAAVTCTLNAAAADSYVAKELAGSNFGTQTTLAVSSDATTTRRGFARFDL